MGRVVFWVLALGIVAGGACGGGDSGNDGSVCDRANTALRLCNLSSGQSECAPTAEGPAGECAVGCLENAECATLTQAFCGSDQAPGEDLLEVVDCVNRCWTAYGFQCASGDQGIEPSLECDGERDCADGSDEVGCAMFACGDGTTVLEALECDGFPDCADNADEATCEVHVCGDGANVPASFRCDGENDCADGSDEVDCDGNQMIQCSAT
jgi:hypothetical protein